MSKTGSKTMINNMTEGPLGKQLLSYALPIMGANLLQALYTMVDLWTVGNFASAAAISAVSISSQIVVLIHAVGIGLGNGGQIFVSQQVGANDLKKLNTTIGTLLTFCTLASTIAAVIGGLGAGFWASLLNTPEEAMTGTINYLVICCLGAPFMCFGGTLCAVLRGVGESKRPMYILMVSALSNCVLDVIFVAGLGWGAAGAAWATMIAQVISAIYALIYVYRIREQLGFDFKPASFRIDGRTLKAILKLGLPLVVESSMITISMIVITAFINVYGVAASAMTGIGSKLNNLVNVVTASMTTAVGSMVAQNFAAGKFDRVRKANWLSMAICMAVFVVLGALVLLFPVQIVGLFTSDADVLALARPYMRTFFWNLLGLCAMSTALGHINGVGFTTLNLVISLLDGVVGRIGLALLLGSVFALGVEGYWWGNALATYITVIMGIGYYLLGHWEKRSALVGADSSGSVSEQIEP